jgi:hypothetical protein
MLDSGGAYGRHWQRNALLCVQDMQDAPRAILHADAYGPCVTLDTFHYLTEWCELADDHAACAMLDRIADENPSESWFHVADMLADEVRELGGSVTDGWNTYNWEQLLSQTLQGYCLTLPDDPRVILAVQVHGGCDVRGGYTRPYLFSIGDGYGEMEYAEGCFLSGTTDAYIYCTTDACDYALTIHGPDVCQDGSLTDTDAIQWDTLTCPECGTANSLRADMQDASY